MNKRQLQLTLASVVAALALLLTGCGANDHDRSGDPGKVTDRDEDHWTTGSRKHRVYHSDYDLTIKRSSDGTEYDIDVSSAAFDHCYQGSSYPKCVDR